MDARSVFRSPPAVAGLILLAVMVGVIFAVRTTMNDGDSTDVAGTVVERSEEPSEVAVAPDDETEPPLIVRPRPEPPDEPRPPVAQDPPPAAPAEPTEPAAGLIRDPDTPVVVAEPDPEPDPDPRGNGGDRDPAPDPDPEPEPDPDPTRRPDPEPDPDPSPDPEPTPSTRQYELRAGQGLTEDVAQAEDPGNSGKYEWSFLNIASGDNQDEQTQRSRKAQARLSVRFSQATTQSEEQSRLFRCDAELAAGSRRLLTDEDHEFVISLWTFDDFAYGSEVAGTRTTVSQDFDLAPGETHRLLSKTVQLDAEADAGQYACRAIYRAK